MDEKYLEIFFPESGRWSKFLYPSCFDSFLKMENVETGEEIARDVEQWRIESSAARKEQWRQEYDKRQQEIKDRKRAAEERKKRAGQRALEDRSNYNRKKEDAGSRNPAAGSMKKAEEGQNAEVLTDVI